MPIMSVSRSGAAAADAAPLKVVIWDEQQPAQKKAYPSFLGRYLADYLSDRFSVAVHRGRHIRAGTGLGVDYALTVSCYQADRDGVACGVCDSCRLRAEGFHAAGVTDPTRYRT